MSQYNLNPFNRSPYNTQPELNINWCKAAFEERITGSFGSAFENYISASFSERIAAEATPTPTRTGRATASETVTAYANAIRWIQMAPIEADETITGTAYLSQIAQMDRTFAENVTGAAEIGKELSLSATMAEEVDGEFALGKIGWATAEAFELVSEVVSVEALSEYTGELAITLQPGQRLIIDAANYNILLDGENVIHTHTGDWLDELNRETINIQIQAASGGSGLDASILYTERYL